MHRFACGMNHHNCMLALICAPSCTLWPCLQMENDMVCTERALEYVDLQGEEGPRGNTGSAVHAHSKSPVCRVPVAHQQHIKQSQQSNPSARGASKLGPQAQPVADVTLTLSATDGGELEGARSRFKQALGTCASRAAALTACLEEGLGGAEDASERSTCYEGYKDLGADVRCVYTARNSMY